MRARNGLGVPVAGAASENDAARAEELHLAQLARQANEGNVFFQAGASHAGGIDATTVGLAGPSPAADGGHQPATLGSLWTLCAIPVTSSASLISSTPRMAAISTIRTASQDPVSPYQVMAGTLISASLITGLDSDLPGLVVAQVTQNIYDTVTGQTLLIPQGSRLIGTYDSVVAFGQSRALVVWQRIIMPDGSSIQIDNLPATDAQGYSGLSDDVDYHTWGAD
ncbi:MAG: TrbI/VirB10 family protein [Rhizomicrobium sp.]